MKNPHAGGGDGTEVSLFCSKPATVEEKRGHWQREE